jgi:hypothetical protein
MAEMDFPAGPYVGQRYTAPSGIVYEWDGYGWVIGFYDTASEELTTVGDLLDQIRSLLQDVDNTSGQYRYSTDSIMLCLNQCMMDLFRMRPDIFVTLKFKIPSSTRAASIRSLVSRNSTSHRSCSMPSAWSRRATTSRRRISAPLLSFRLSRGRFYP